MRMNRQADIGRVRAHLQRQPNLGDQVTCVWTDNAASKETSARLVEQQLGKTLVATERQSTAACRPGKSGNA